MAGDTEGRPAAWVVPLTTDSTTVPPADVDVVAQLADITRLLEESWIQDVYPMLVSIHEYRQLAESLTGYPGSAIIQWWYASFVLAGCRRAVDYNGDDVLSIRKALHRLRKIAREVGTAELMASRRSHSPQVDDTEDSLREEFALVDGHLDVATVQADLDKINDVGDRVHTIVTNTVAHRLPVNESAQPLTGREVVQLVDDLAEIYRDWSIVLRATDIASTHDTQNLLGVVSRALKLFDWEAYVEAQSEVIKRAGPAGNVNFADLDARAHLEYRFD